MCTIYYSIYAAFINNNIMSEFTFASVKQFDQHITQSIRGYNDLIDDIVGLSRYFVEPDTNVLDIGCSTGTLLSRLTRDVDRYMHQKDSVKFIGIDIEPKFIKSAKKATTGTNTKIKNTKIQKYVFENNMSFVTSVFTLQFISKKHRNYVIDEIYDKLNVGGAFVLCEKILPEHPTLHQMITSIHHDYKRKSFTCQDIMDKDVSLRHMMKTDTKKQIITNLERAGFDVIDIFWQQHEFVGFVAIKQ